MQASGALDLSRLHYLMNCWLVKICNLICNLRFKDIGCAEWEREPTFSILGDDGLYTTSELLGPMEDEFSD